MLDSGCNVTLLNGGTPVWRSSHSIPAQGPCFATIQTDGNFVIYLGTPQQRGIALWSSGTFGPSPLPFFLTLQDDGKLVIYKGAATWATGTKGLVAPGPGPWTNRSTLAAGQVLTAPVSLPSPSGEYVAIMQSDGNFVIRETHGNLLLWNSGTALGRGNFFAAMQTDGLVVLYKGTPEQGGSAYWVSGTFNPFPLPFFLTMQDDGNLVIYRGNSIWSQPGS